MFDYFDSILFREEDCTFLAFPVALQLLQHLVLRKVLLLTNASIRICIFVWIITTIVLPILRYYCYDSYRKISFNKATIEITCKGGTELTAFVIDSTLQDLKHYMQFRNSRWISKDCPFIFISGYGGSAKKLPRIRIAEKTYWKTIKPASNK